MSVSDFRSSTDFGVIPMTYEEIGAGNEIRTRDPNLGKVVLYQLSYSRDEERILQSPLRLSSILLLQ